MKNKIISLIAVLTFAAGYSAHAQIAIAVAKDENRSTIHWQLVWNAGYKTESIAKQKLRDMGYENVFTLTGGKDCGHNLTSGYWVIVETTFKMYDGKMKTSYGLGASSHSYSEAENRAVKNLSIHDWSWSKKHGYQVIERGTF